LYGKEVRTSAFCAFRLRGPIWLTLGKGEISTTDTLCGNDVTADVNVVGAGSRNGSVGADDGSVGAGWVGAGNGSVGAGASSVSASAGSVGAGWVGAGNGSDCAGASSVSASAVGASTDGDGAQNGCSVASDGAKSASKYTCELNWKMPVARKPLTAFAAQKIPAHTEITI